MSLKRVGVVLFASAVGLSLAATVPAQGGTSGGSGPSPGVKRVTFNGQKVLQSKAKLLKVIDGDTIRVDISGDNKGAVLVRNAGMNTFEKGECHYRPATKAMKKIVSKKLVLRSSFDTKNVNKTSGRSRLQRYVFTSRGVDLQEEMIARGLALPFNFGKETLRQEVYAQRAQEAAASGLGIYDTDRCGYGPSQEASLDLVVHYDASGKERANLNGKFVRIVNNGPAAVDLTGWFIITGKTRYYFPSGTVVQPGAPIKLHMGKGVNTATDLYWGDNKLRLPVPKNSRYQGVGTILIDPDGDARAWGFYPCRVDCGHPAQGAIKVSVVNPKAGGGDRPNEEAVTFTNITGQPVDMSYLVTEIRFRNYEFPNGVYLDPGESLSVWMGAGSADRLNHYLGESESYLPGGGLIRLRDDRAVELTCYTWGNWKC